MTNRALWEAALYKAESGGTDATDLVEIEIIRWQNPGRKRGELRQWRTGNQADAWATLGPPLAAAIRAQLATLPPAPTFGPGGL